MSYGQDREHPTFRLRRVYRSEPDLNPEVAKGEDTTSLGGEEPHTSADGELRPLLSLSHRRSAPTRLSSYQPTREFRGAATGLRHQPRRRSASPGAAPGRDPRGAAGVEGPDTQSLRSGTPFIPPTRPKSLHSNMKPETNQNEALTVETAAETGRKAEEPGEGASCIAKKSESDAEAKVKAKKERNRISARKSYQAKKKSTADLERRKANMEAEIKQLEDSQRTLQKECAIASNQLSYKKVHLYELKQHFLGEGARGEDEWKRVEEVAKSA